MLASAHDEMRSWLSRIAEDGDEGLQVVDDDTARPECVRLRLGGVIKDDPTDSDQVPGTMALRLRYVIGVTATPVAALGFLERFLIELRTRKRSYLRLELDPFDVVPRLSHDEVGLVVDVGVVAAPEVEATKLVTKPLVLDAGGLARLSGVVRGHGLPLPGAEVLLTSLGKAVQTDSKGRFTFSRVPAHPEVQKLSIEVKGRTFYADADVTVDEPLVINCDL